MKKERERGERERCVMVRIEDGCWVCVYIYIGWVMKDYGGVELAIQGDGGSFFY